MPQVKDIVFWPAKWLVNIVEVQEKKAYSFYVVLLFAMFVGLVRYSLEVMLSHKVLFQLNTVVISSLTFYLHVIFIYLFILWLMVPGLEWKKSIYLVLIGVFLGIFPPLIDIMIYGVGGFSYKFMGNDWNWLIYDDVHVPKGEAITVLTTIFLVAIVVFLKTKSWIRASIALMLSYGSIFLYGGLVPYASKVLIGYFDPGISPSPMDGSSVTGSLHQPSLVGFLQLSICIVIYLILNPGIAPGLLKRSNHVLPVFLTCLLGYGLFAELDAYAFFIALIAMFAGYVVLIQNEYFDRDQDEIQGRQSYVNLDDMQFFNAALLIMVALLVADGYLAGYMILLFYVVFILYNYDFYRGKKYFPTAYKIEGVAGLAAFLAGAMMVLSTKYQLVGGVVLETDMQLFTKSFRFQREVSDQVWVSSSLLFSFFVFGGWSVLSVIKDYKDIDADLAAGNQTFYTLMVKNGRDFRLAHKRYTLLLAVLMLLPIYSLLNMNLPVWIFGAFPILAMLFYFSVNRDPSTKTVEQSLFIVNLYLLNLVICFFSRF